MEFGWDAVNEWQEEKKYKCKQEPREYGICPICKKWRLLDGHGVTTRAKSKKKHDEEKEPCCGLCHINKVHDLDAESFKKKTGQEKSKYLKERDKDCLKKALEALENVDKNKTS